MDLLNEFNEHTETFFLQDQVCYSHYKEMQSAKNNSYMERPEKKHFKRNLIIHDSATQVFAKKAPSWASDFVPLAKVVKL